MLLEALKYDNRIFGLDPQLLFQVAFQMLAIFILFLLASYLLLDPVRKILNDRKERVMKEQKEAKESREQAIRFKDEYDTKLKRIDKEAEQIADYLIFNMKNNGAYEVKDPEIIEKMVDLVTKDRKKPAVNFVGKSAQYILDKVGIKVGPEVKCIIMEAPKDHPFVQIELMMPILPIVRVPNVDEAIDFAVEVEHGNRHTAMMHSKNVDKLTKMAKEIETTIFVKNGPSYAGIGVGGMGYTTFTIAGPTGEGLTSAKSFCRKRRCVLQDGLHIRMK